MSFLFKHRWLDRALHRRHYEAFIVFLLIVGLMGWIGSLYLSSGEAARRTVCRSNLRQLTQALELYAQDHDGRYPLPARWVKASARYVDSLGVFFCPSDERPRRLRERQQPAVSYWYRPPRSDHEPSATPVLGDVVYTNGTGNHEEGGNVAYLDGHVVWTSFESWQKQHLPLETLQRKGKPFETP